MKVVNFVGYSGSGKTTLIEKLLRIFTDLGLKTAAIKNAHHHIETDKPGKDSYRYRTAGASQIILRSGERWAMFTEAPQGSPSLRGLLSKLDPADLTVVEGFKSEEDNEALKIEVWRDIGRKEPPICTRDEGIAAVASDVRSPLFGDLPLLDINDAEAVAAWVLNRLEIQTKTK